jgi:hypothetical protein
MQGVHFTMLQVVRHNIIIQESGVQAQKKFEFPDKIMEMVPIETGCVLLINKQYQEKP